MLDAYAPVSLGRIEVKRMIPATFRAGEHLRSVLAPCLQGRISNVFLVWKNTDLLNPGTTNVAATFEIGQADIDREANLIWRFVGRDSRAGIRILPGYVENLRADNPHEI